MSARYKTLIIVLILLALLIGASLLILKKYREPKPKMYAGFGLKLPENYRLTGIDVSRYQDHIFWEEVAAMNNQDRRLSFVFVKATECNNSTDRNFERNWEEAGKVKLVRGAYHVFHPSVDVPSQAERYLSTITLKAGDFVPVLDVELTENVPPPAIRDSVCKWLTMVEARLKVRPIIYSGASFYNANLLGYFDDYPLWIAHYKTDKPAVNRGWHFWQFSDCGQVNGINCPVDFNVFCGDSLALHSLTLQ